MNKLDVSNLITQEINGLLCTETERLYIGASLSEERIKKAIKAFSVSVIPEDIVCIIDESIFQNASLGFLFTPDKLYYRPSLSKSKKIWFDEIDSINVITNNGKTPKSIGIEILMNNKAKVRIISSLVNADILQVTLEKLKHIALNRPFVGQQTITYKTDDFSPATAVATVVADRQVANKLFDEEKFHARQGHGFAAERANDFYDRIHGKDTKIVGDDNAKNGPDRIVDGVWVQSKYCKTGADCIKACFDESGKGNFRYIGKNGKPMVIEVPKDEAIYNDALKKMENQIREGKVPGVNDPAEAKKIVRRGNFTYKQARNIAKAGNVDSLTYDAANGLVTSVSAFGISAVLAFATSVWNNDPVDVALQKAATHGLKVSGTAFVTSVVASQLSKAGLNSILVGSSEAIVQTLGPKASAVIINAFRSGGNIYGAAAMKSAAKLLRGNTVTATVTVAVLSAFDVADIFRGRISGAQLFKNIAGTTTTVAGGTAGWVCGAAAGSMVLPGVGSVIGGLVGTFVAGTVAGKATKVVLDNFIEDDADKMVEIIQKRFLSLAQEYMLNRNEAEKVVDALGDILDGKKLKLMFSSSDKDIYADKLLLPLIEDRVRKRNHIPLPSTEDMSNALRKTLEVLSEETGYDFEEKTNG